MENTILKIIEIDKETVKLRKNADLAIKERIDKLYSQLDEIEQEKISEAHEIADDISRQLEEDCRTQADLVLDAAKKQEREMEERYQKIEDPLTRKLTDQIIGKLGDFSGE